MPKELRAVFSLTRFSGYDNRWIMINSHLLSSRPISRIFTIDLLNRRVYPVIPIFIEPNYGGPGLRVELFQSFQTSRV